MHRTTIELPDDLIERARAFGSGRALSVEEVLEQGLELLLGAPDQAETGSSWQMPTFDGGGLLVAPEDLKALAFDDREAEVIEGVRGGR